jgi:hypothetical protein
MKGAKVDVMSDQVVADPQFVQDLLTEQGASPQEIVRQVAAAENAAEEARQLDEERRAHETIAAKDPVGLARLIVDGSEAAARREFMTQAESEALDFLIQLIEKEQAGTLSPGDSASLEDVLDELDALANDPSNPGRKDAVSGFLADLRKNVLAPKPPPASSRLQQRIEEEADSDEEGGSLVGGSLVGGAMKGRRRCLNRQLAKDYVVWVTAVRQKAVPMTRKGLPNRAAMRKFLRANGLTAFRARNLFAAYDMGFENFGLKESRVPEFEKMMVTR